MTESERILKILRLCGRILPKALRLLGLYIRLLGLNIRLHLLRSYQWLTHRLK